MQFINLIALTIASISAWDQCPADTGNCGSSTPSTLPTSTASYPPYPTPSSTTGTMFANIFSAPDFKGDTQVFNIDGAWGCVDLPNYQIQSALSTATTQLTFHYGPGCVAHVIKQVQGGFNSTDTPICAGSLFIKLNRYGSC